LLAGDADAALGGDVCVDAGRGGLGAASTTAEDDDDDDAAAAATADDSSSTASRSSRSAARAARKALLHLEGELSGYGRSGDGSVRLRVRGGDATRLHCSSGAVNVTAPQVCRLYCSLGRWLVDATCCICYNYRNLVIITPPSSDV
jgi:hypothetical protein